MHKPILISSLLALFVVGLLFFLNPLPLVSLSTNILDNPNTCSMLSNQCGGKGIGTAPRTSCQYQYALHKKNSEYCRLIEDNCIHESPSLIIACVEEISPGPKNSEFCEGSTDADACYYFFAKKYASWELCDLISDKLNKFYCPSS